MTIVIRIELRIFDYIVTSVSFGHKNWKPLRNAEVSKWLDCHGKVAACEVLIYSLNMTFADKMHIFSKEWSVLSLILL